MPALSGQLRISEAVDDMIVHHADRLHVRVDDRRADEAETAPFQVLAQRLGFLAGGGELLQRAPAVDDRAAVDEAPEIGVEATTDTCTLVLPDCVGVLED